VQKKDLSLWHFSTHVSGPKPKTAIALQGFQIQGSNNTYPTDVQSYSPLIVSMMISLMGDFPFELYLLFIT
jgi:hypothetical protein